MLYLGLSLLFSASIFVIFKLFSKYRVHNLQAIVVNYLVAALLGFGFAGFDNVAQIAQANWLPIGLIIGLMFISLFNIMARTAQEFSISVASVANKLSVVIPVAFAFLFYGDQITFFKVLGILLALIGVVYITKPAKDSGVNLRGAIWLPLVLFIGSGVLDTLMKYTEANYLTDNDNLLFIPTLFAVAGMVGLIYLLFSRNRQPLQFKSVIWGLILGIPNYFSIYFLLKTLSLPGFESSVIFPINNLGVVGLSALLSVLIFKEKLTKQNQFGLAAAALGILLLALQ